MKKNFKLMLFALAAMTAGFTSCSNEGDENLATGGEKGKFAFSFSPIGLATRAIDLNHTASESAVTNVTLFVYRTNGSLERIDNFVAADLSFNTGTGVWSLNAGKEVEVIAETNKSVYVGVNMPATLVSAIQGKAGAGMSMASAYDEALATMTAPSNFTMFSDRVELVDVTAGATANTTNIAVSRLAAKVSVKYDNTKLTGGSVSVAGGTIALSSLKWAVENQNPEFRILSPYGTSAFSPDFSWTATPAGDYQVIAGDNPGATPAVDDDAVYVMENVPDVSNSPLSDVVTYVRLRCVFTPSQLLDGAGNSAGAGTPGTTFWTVPNPSGGVAYFGTLAHANAWLAANNPSAAVSTYTNGECDYGIFINRTAGKYDVVRNHYYAVTIEAINGIGIPTDPNTPIDPTAKGKLDFALKVNNWVPNSSNEQI